MRFFPGAGVLGQRFRSTRRRSGRLPLDTLKSNLGEVVDISAGGMRVIGEGLPREQRIAIRLEGYMLPGPLVGTVTWTRRFGFFRKQIGLRFDDVSPEMARALTMIADGNRRKRTI